MPAPAPRPESLASLIYLIRGEKVLLDADLPGDFMFRDLGRVVPFEMPHWHFKSARRAKGCSLRLYRAGRGNAVQRSAFASRKIEALEKKYDEQFAVVFDAIKRLVAEDEARKARPKRRIGFSS